MSINITWGLIARMDGILSAEPLMYCIHTNSHNFTWSPNPGYGTLNTGGAWLQCCQHLLTRNPKIWICKENPVKPHGNR